MMHLDLIMNKSGYIITKKWGDDWILPVSPFGDDIQFYLWGSYEYVGWWIRVVYWQLEHR